MTINSLQLAAGLVGILTATTAIASSHSKHPDDSQLRACRDSLAYHSDFKKLPMAAFSVYPGSHEHGNVDWSVAWEGRQANGSCKVTGKGKIEHFKVRYDSGPVHSEKHHKDHKNGGFYYDRHAAKWRDPSGAVCHTCTPENGFPDHRHADKKWKADNHLEREMARQMNRQLSEQDIKNINKMYNNQ
jgi:hypothetical protein